MVISKCRVIKRRRFKNPRKPSPSKPPPPDFKPSPFLLLALWVRGFIKMGRSLGMGGGQGEYGHTQGSGKPNQHNHQSFSSRHKQALHEENGESDSADSLILFWRYHGPAVPTPSSPAPPSNGFSKSRRSLYAGENRLPLQLSGRIQHHSEAK